MPTVIRDLLKTRRFRDYALDARGRRDQRAEMGPTTRKCIVFAFYDIAIVLFGVWVTVTFPNVPHWILLALVFVALAAAVTAWNHPHVGTTWRRR